jgi:N-hydroxyarylamine O-acetyltransferase
MNLDAYLERISYQGSFRPDGDSLRTLQLAHLYRVPFENLSIHTNEKILLQEEWLYDKFVRRRRGGFCYELNGLFAVLLRQLGFPVTLLSAGVARADGSFGPDFDHLALLVSLKNRWLVDVGFGDSFHQPLLLDRCEVQAQDTRAYQITADGEALTLNEREPEAEWKPQYRFTLQAHELRDYEAMCHYHQTSPLTSFTQQRVCSLAKPGGRITLTDKRLLETIGHARHERWLTSEEEYNAVLTQTFSILL